MIHVIYLTHVYQFMVQIGSVFVGFFSQRSTEVTRSMLPLSDKMSHLGMLAVGAVGGVLLGLGLRNLTTRRCGRLPRPLRGQGHMQLYHTHVYRSSRAKWAIEGIIACFKNWL